MLRFILLTGVVLASSPASALDLPTDYIFEARLDALSRCENDDEKRHDFYCGRFMALSDVLVQSGLCQRTDGSWVEGEAGVQDILCTAQ